MTAKRFSFRIRPWMASMLLVTATLLSAAGCDLLPWQKDAEFQKRVKNDSFPTADQALHAPAVDGNSNHTRDGN